jgi:hypothetical protein
LNVDRADVAHELSYEETIAKIVDDLAGWWVSVAVRPAGPDAPAIAWWAGEVSPVLNDYGRRERDHLAMSIGGVELRFERSVFDSATWRSATRGGAAQRGDSLTILARGTTVTLVLAPPQL